MPNQAFLVQVFQDKPGDLAIADVHFGGEGYAAVEWARKRLEVLRNAADPGGPLPQQVRVSSVDGDVIGTFPASNLG